MVFIAFIVGFLSLGVLVGFALRRTKIRGLSHTSMWLICLLLFYLGLEIGSNHEALSQLNKLGVKALLLTIGSVGGSILLAWGLWIIRKRLAKQDRSAASSSLNAH